MPNNLEYYLIQIYKKENIMKYQIQVKIIREDQSCEWNFVSCQIMDNANTKLHEIKQIIRNFLLLIKQLT